MSKKPRIHEFKKQFEIYTYIINTYIYVYCQSIQIHTCIHLYIYTCYIYIFRYMRMVLYSKIFASNSNKI